MSGLAEVLDENSRLREAVHTRDAQLAAQAEQLSTQAARFEAQLAALCAQVEALKASNENFARHFEFLGKRRKLAAAERFVAAELQAPLFEGINVAAPPRDPERKAAAEDETPKSDGRKTAKHPRKGRRDVRT